MQALDSDQPQYVTVAFFTEVVMYVVMFGIDLIHFIMIGFS